MTVFSDLFWKSTRIPLGIRSFLGTVCPRDIRSSYSQHNGWNAMGSKRRLATGWETADSATTTKSIERWLVEGEGDAEVDSPLSE